MPIWTIASVTTEPQVTLSRWRILETEEGTRHFVGADTRDFTGRVSSAIVVFDPHTRRGQTISGRIYQLIGEPSWSSDADYVWGQWCRVNSVQSHVDVTKQLLGGVANENSI
ncbi:hypothetical protein L3V59_40030 [Burkholderia aenigmatica]|uniref:hypothetical protein n=1 Tax=Burkholderia aenigmatica TaxID=2015348 RepID=UPI0015833498|nr:MULTISPECIES: hypothetical protein [Burkholderia cepacia complex]UKD16857.1 hypothetical protein L3V59_40030 [Burkholderia aenigmatica]